jgi:hypothetical protein
VPDRLRLGLGPAAPATGAGRAMELVIRIVGEHHPDELSRLTRAQLCLKPDNGALAHNLPQLPEGRACAE